MPYKLCPNCNQTSYSASDHGLWKCPYCGRDISFIRSAARQPKDGERNKGILPSHLRLVR